MASKKKPRKQSSPKASAVAGKYMRRMRTLLQLGRDTAHEDDLPLMISLPVAELGVLCASVLAQDETKGQKRDRRRR